MATRPLTTSRRERRLWLATAAVMIAIYSTLGVAGTIADELRERNLLRASFALFGVVVAVVAWRWLSQRPARSELGVAIGVALAFLMVASRISSWEERTHLIEYGIVAALIHQALLERLRNGRNVPVPAALAMGATGVLGVIDECIQAVLPNRVFDPRDIFFNAFAGFMVVAGRLAIAPQRQVGWRVWFLWLLACFFGWGWGVYLGWFDNSDPVFIESVPPDYGAAWLGLVVGAVLAAGLQWLVIRPHGPGPVSWLGAAAAASALTGVLFIGLTFIDTHLGWRVAIIGFGPLLAVLQWTILRRHVQPAALWIPAATLAWIAGVPFGDLNGPVGLGGLYGVITATALVLLLRQQAVATPVRASRRSS